MANIVGRLSRPHRSERRGSKRFSLMAGALVLTSGLGIGLAGLAQAPASASSAKILPYTLAPGSSLVPGDWMVSPNGKYWFGIGKNGNLALYLNGHSGSIWSAMTGGHWGATALLQRDGTLVVYYQNKPIWSTRTGSKAHTDAYLQVQNDGYVTLYSQKHQILWSTYTPPPTLSYGSTGSYVTQLQERLTALGYWVGPTDGVFGDSTQQAVWALQKAANLSRTGVVDPSTWAALNKGVVPAIRPASGNLIEVNLNLDLLMIIGNGKLRWILNTSTGGGYQYVEGGQTYTAITPTGVYHTFYSINGSDTDPLGTLWRPRFFYEGYAIHGDSYVPPVPVSHGCVRVSNEAIDWIWATNQDPIGQEVWIYG